MLTNPVKSVLRIESDDYLKTILIYDSSGKKVYQCDLKATGRQASISVEHLSPGTYLARVESQNGV